MNIPAKARERSLQIYSCSPRLEAAASEEEHAKVKKEASQEMKRAVEERGISVDKYKEILASALTNPELAQRVNKYLEGTRA